MRKFLVGLLAVAALALQAGHATAQSSAPFNVVTAYDLDSTTFVYPFFEALKNADQRIQTVGSSTTVTAVSGTPFANVGVGDELDINVNGVTTLRWVATKVDGTQITVDTAITLTGGFPFSYRHLSTTTSAGWQKVSTYACSVFTVQIDQANTTTGITWQEECRTSASVSTGVIVNGPVTVLNAAVPYSKGAADCLPWDSCRLGIKLTSTDDGGDTGANAEKVNIYFAGVVR